MIQIANLQKLQNRAARIITGASYLQRSSDVFCELGWMTLEAMRKRQEAILMFKILNGLTPPYLSEMFTHSASFHDYGLPSSKMNLALPKRFLQKQFCIYRSEQFKGREFIKRVCG